MAPPALRTLWHSSEDAVAAEQTATFGNSNEVCRIRSISLREDDVNFSFARIILNVLTIIPQAKFGKITSKFGAQVIDGNTN